ncbi:MAG: hypothetical protein IJR65_06165 [Oscillospiraceae bacterium]|nr:hypothetical protein [Oscillospiraceae bacterium]
MDKERLRSLLRRAMIVLLTVSAVFLSWRTGYFNAPARETGSGTEASAAEEQRAPMPLRPIGILATRADGSRAAALYDASAVDAAFAPLAALLGEALGTASEPEAMSEAEFRALLEGESALLDLGAEYPLKLLASWLGAGGGNGGAAELLCLAGSASGVALAYRTADGGFFRCDTATNRELLSARLAELTGEAAGLAFEEAGLGSLDPFLILPETGPTAFAVAVSPAYPDAGALMDAFGMNRYVASAYRENDGTQVYVDGDRTLRIAADGTVSYRARAAEGDGQSAIESALRLSEAALGRLDGDAVLGFVRCEAEGERETVVLDYRVNNVPVTLAAGNAAVLEYRNGALSGATLLSRAFQLTESDEPVLPTRFAAAIAAAGEGGGLHLRYVERSDGLRCLWVYD